MNANILKLLTVMFLVLVQVGCVAYPTKRSYYQPVPSHNQSKVKSQSCGYHKAAEDGLKSLWGQSEIRVYPDNDSAKPLNFVVVIDGLNQPEQWQNFWFELKDTHGNLWKPTIAKLSHTLKTGVTFKTWLYVEFPTEQNIENSSLQKIEFKLHKDEKQIEIYHFEHKQVSDIYYSSINC